MPRHVSINALPSLTVIVQLMTQGDVGWQYVNSFLHIEEGTSTDTFVMQSQVKAPSTLVASAGSVGFLKQ